MKGKVFRIGHLGNMDELMLSSALCGAEMALIDAGVPVTPGEKRGRKGMGWVGCMGGCWGETGRNHCI